MGSVILALFVLAIGIGLMWFQDKPAPAHARRNGSDNAMPNGSTRNNTDNWPRYCKLGITMKYDAPCPRCEATPVEMLRMVDGRAWICPHCGHQETKGVADIDAFVEELGSHDPETVAAWRRALGLDPRAS